MRATPVEAYDPSTGKPAHLFPTLLAAHAAGFKRASIGRCIAGARRTHGGFAWRVAPPEAGAVEFALQNTRPAADRILLDEFAAKFGRAIGQPVRPHVLAQRLRWAGINVAYVPVRRREGTPIGISRRGPIEVVYGDVLAGRAWDCSPLLG